MKFQPFESMYLLSKIIGDFPAIAIEHFSGVILGNKLTLPESEDWQISSQNKDGKFPREPIFFVHSLHGWMQLSEKDEWNAYEWMKIMKSRWSFQICFIFTPKIGEMIQFD